MDNMDANHDFSMYPEARPQPPPSNPLAVVALVIALIALPLSLIPAVGLLVSLVALVLGIAAKGKARQGAGNGAAIGAIVAAAVALLMSLITSACTLLVVQGAKTVDRELKNQGVDLQEIAEKLKSQEARAHLGALKRDLEIEVHEAGADDGSAPAAASADASSAPSGEQVPAGELGAVRRLLDRAVLEKMAPEQRQRVEALLKEQIDARQGSSAPPAAASAESAAAPAAP